MAKTVLAVDNDPAVLNKVTTSLDRRYRVWNFRDPRAALKAIAEGLTPQLVLCSLRMQGMAGLDFKEELRANRRLGALPVIFLVGYREQKFFDQILPGERETRLVKPFGRLELRELVDRYLDYPTRF